MPDNQYQDVTLETIGGGAALARFQQAWADVLKNIADPNTDPKAVREVVVRIRVRPNEDREQLKTMVMAMAKIAPARPVESTAFLGKRDGSLVAVAFNPNQNDLFRTEADSKVAPITVKRAEGQ